MQLIFAGSGSAFTVGANNYHSNMLLIHNEKCLLIDCGSDARLSLYDLNHSYRDITDVYISHLHADHAGGLEWLALTRYFDPLCGPANLYANIKVMDAIWEHSLSAGLSTIQGVQANVNTFFKPFPISENGSFMWEGIEFQTIQTIHIVAGYSFMPSYGLIFKINGNTIFITTDTQFAPNQLRDFYKMADIIFHDCETIPHKSGVHAHFSELITLPEEFRQKMWLYHYNPGPLPEAKANNFLGFVKRGQIFDF